MDQFPTIRVIIDCTEVCCEMPSSFLLNSELFSSYKNNVTLKGLVGIAPSSTITFIILQAKKFLKCDWLRPVVFEPNLKLLQFPWRPK